VPSIVPWSHGPRTLGHCILGGLLVAGLAACGGGGLPGATPSCSAPDRLVVSNRSVGRTISITVTAQDAAPCRIKLPVQVSVAGGSPGGGNPEVRGDPASATVVGDGILDDGPPFVEFVWANWCGPQQPPFALTAMAARGRVAATDELPAGPACDDPSKPSTLTLHSTGPPRLQP
jgi:hypothetical protein